MLDYLVENFLLIYLLEVGAAIAGSVYIIRSYRSSFVLKVFVGYLWFMICVETIGFYPAYAYFSDYTSLSFIKDTPFERNFWLYNIHKIVSSMAYLSFFICQLEERKLRRIFWILLGFFTISSVLNLIFSGVFFVRHSTYTTVLGTIFLVILILVYYYELLRSNRILDFYNDYIFYISVGALVWHLSVTPLFIYNNYFSLQSPDFIILHSWILRMANIFLYGNIIMGFWLSYRKDKINLRKV